MSAEASAEVVEGVSLAHFAAVKAAVTEGFDEQEVLALEGIAPDAWREANCAWTARVASDPSGPLFTSYQGELVRAQNNLARDVKPLQTDLAAWLGFLDAFSGPSGSFELLEQHELGMNDVARLERLWSSRMSANAEIKKEATELRKRKRLALPAIVVGPKVLKRSAYATGAPSPNPEVGGAEEDVQGELPLDQYAALMAELGVEGLALTVRAGPRVENIAAKYGLTLSKAIEEDRLWREVRTSNAEVDRDFRQLYAHFERRQRIISEQAKDADSPRREEPTVSTPPIASIRPSNLLRSTALALDIPRGPTLPFARSAEPSVLAKADSVAVPLPKIDSGTALALDIPRGPAVPFSSDGGVSGVKPPPDSEDPKADRAPPKMPRVVRLPDALMGRSLSLDIPRGLEMPSATGGTGSSSTPPPARSPDAAPTPAVTKAPSALQGTALALDIPRGPDMPFAASVSVASSVPPPPPRAPEASPKPVVTKAPSALQGTALALDIPRGPDMPFAPSGSAASSGPPSPPRRPEASPKPVVTKAPSALQGTALALDIPRGPDMPFAPSGSAASSVPPPPAPRPPQGPPKPVVAKAPAALQGTALALDIPRGPDMPFTSTAASAPPAISPPSLPKPAGDPLRGTHAPPAKRVLDKAPKPLAGTSLLLDIPQGPLPPPKQPAASAPTSKAPSQPAPITRQQPMLTIEQHASLSFELYDAPERAAEALARYRISPAEKDATDAYWRERMQSDPSLKPAWDRAYRLYEEWWRSKVGRR